MKYRVVIGQDKDGVFVADVPALPGCISQGNTRTEVLCNIQEAIKVYLESLKVHGEPILPSINEEKIKRFSEKDNLKETMKMSEASFMEWDNENDEIYNKV